jgi:molybdopterin-containing oxidoreductase family molybdopterin binding subunit
VRNDNVVRVRAKEIPGNEAMGIMGGDDIKRICARGASIPYQIVNEKRIKYPMRRVGERGGGQWERISWDEAINEICSNIKKLQSSFGPNSVCAFTYGTMEARHLWGVNRLQNVAQFSNQHRTTDFAYSDAVFSNIGTFFFNGENSSIIRGLKTVVVWGHNPCEAWPQTWRYIADAKEFNGAKLVVIDPNYNTTASKSDLFVSLRHGSDGALALGLINYLEQNRLVAEDFLKAKTCAPFLVKPDGKFLRKSDLDASAAEAQDDFVVFDEAANSIGYAQTATDPAIRKADITIDGVELRTAYDMLIEQVSQYSLRKTSEITGVPEDTIVELSKLISSNSPTEIIQGYAIDHYGNGFGTEAAVNALRIVCGMPQAPEAKFSLNETGFTPEEAGHPLLGDNLATFMFHDLLDKGRFEMPGKTIEVPLKALVSFGGNIVNSCPDREQTIAAYKKFDFIAVINVEWGDTADLADIVLPACMTQETVGATVINECLVVSEQCITPKWEAKSDFEICSLIAHGLGLGEWFDYDADHAIGLAISTSPALAMAGASYDALKTKKIIRLGTMPLPQYMTPTGRLQFYLEDAQPFAFYGQALDAKKHHLPAWEPPLEAWPEAAGGYPANPLSEKYPLCIHAGTRRFRVHSYYGWEEMLRELEYDEPIVRMNPVDAEARGIAEGDYVRCYNDRGHAVAKAVFHPGLRPGGLDIDRGWQGSQYKSGCSQNLTAKTISNWNCPNYSYHDCLCEVEKWQG